MHDAELIANFVQGLAKSNAVMSSVHLHKPKERFSFDLVAVQQLFDLVTSCCKVAVPVWSHPHIVGQTNFTTDSRTLHRKLDSLKIKMRRTLKLRHFFNAFICSLNCFMISWWVCFHEGNFMPQVKHAAILTIFWNLGCSKAWIGCGVGRQSWFNIWALFLTWLVSISHLMAASLKFSSLYGVGFSSAIVGLKWSSTEVCWSSSSARTFRRSFMSCGNIESKLLVLAHFWYTRYGF